MPTLDTLTPDAVAIVRLFAYPLRSAPTADLVAWGTAELQHGRSAGEVLSGIFELPIPESPFTAYAADATDQAFCAALVENFCFDAAIPAETKARWIAELLPLVPGQPSRGDFALWVGALVEDYRGGDADLLALQAALAQRLERAAGFAQSPEGAIWEGQGYAQLLAPLLPPPPPAAPTYGLSASASTVDEGDSVVFSLHTTGLPAGTRLAYSLSGSGLDAGDLDGAPLRGDLVLDSDGRASVSIRLRADATTEGAEILRLALDGLPVHAEVTVNDSSTTPAPPSPPTYALSASASAVDEGGSVTITLSTRNLPAGSSVGYELSGAGIDAADFCGAPLAGRFVVDAAGLATLTLGPAADRITEGTETLRLTLEDHRGSLELQINDTSLSPPPVGAPDTLIVADQMPNGRAHPPASPAEGEIRFDSYLSFDLLNQSGAVAKRMSVADLQATHPVAGAPLDATNSSADRGNVPQVSNPQLFTFDLGLQTDRVDYSAESGRIAAVLSAAAPPETLWVLVNDDGVDDDYAGPTGRVDTLVRVEEVVASAGGGVIDLTHSGRDWRVEFSRGFDAAADVDAPLDRATHRLLLVDAASGSPHGQVFLEYRDAGGNAAVTQATAAWTSVQGSDRDETLVFTSAQSTEARSNVLRGGSNAVKFNELTRSILVDVAITPWVPSSDPADDTNATGLTTATVVFTNGDGVTPLSGNTNVITAHTPDHGVAPGMLTIVGSQDAEDALDLAGTAFPKQVTLGQAVDGGDGFSVRLAGVSTGSALQARGFEWLRDNGASDDLYVIENIFLATQGSPRLTDGAGVDHDGIRIGNDALGSAAVGGVAGSVSLAALSGPAPGFGVGFEVLDLSGVSASALQVQGTAGIEDELVLGALASIGLVSGFEALVLNDASVDKGTALTLDLDAGVLKAGATPLFAYSGSVISAGGLVFGSAGADRLVAPARTPFSITVVDSGPGAGATVWGGAADDHLTGGSGNDRLRGGGGNDTLDGGSGADTFVLEGTAAANGHDTLLNFTPASDKIDVSAFAGAAVGAASPWIDGAVGGVLAGVPTTAELIYNRAGGTISAADFAAAAQPGKFVLADGGRCVVVVTADPTGAHGDAANTRVALYYAENGPEAGLGDLSVMLVATLDGPLELSLNDVLWALS
ncbi:MAG: hypothetical protein AMXMBFR78_33240 [Rubrivivax sp.]